MQRTFPSILSTLLLATLSCFISLSARGQVTPDGTTSTTVNGDGNNFAIEQGDRVGDNLFHSFNEFSVPTGGSAVFNNAGDIANIFSRVTGGSISSIDGLLGANGTANLYLINPNGIIFGENASLNLGGSFFASTADSLLFEGDTEFSSVNPTAPPLLEVSIPIGARFRDNPGDIVNTSIANNANGLEILPGSSITLLGGNVRFDGGSAIFAPDARVQLGGIITAGVVELNVDGSTIFPNDVTRGDVSLTNNSDVFITGAAGGAILINAKNLELISSSDLSASIDPNLASADARVGDIVIDATESVIFDNSNIINAIPMGAAGSGGKVDITTTNLFLINQSSILAGTLGQGNAGVIEIKARESIILDGQSFIDNTVFLNAVGNGGEIDITTNNLLLGNASGISSGSGGIGNAGAIEIDAAESISLNDSSSIRTTNSATGNSGAIDIETPILSLSNSFVDASLSGEGNGSTIAIDAESIDLDNSSIASAIAFGGVGNAGNIEITTANLTASNGTQINTAIFGNGDGGTFTLDATESVIIDSNSFVTSLVSENSTGNAGNINLKSTNLVIKDDSQINATIIGEGEGGQIEIAASESIVLDRGTISNAVLTDGEGNGGNLSLTTTNLTANESLISSGSLGLGNAGAVIIKATESIDLNNTGVSNFIGAEAVGDAGELSITATNLKLNDSSSIFSNSSGVGDGGVIALNVSESIDLDTSFVSSGIETGAVGQAGELNITATDLTLTDAGINVDTDGRGDGGTIDVNAKNIVLNGSRISNTVGTNAIGNGGAIALTTANLSLTDSNIDVSSSGSGNSGAIDINATQSISLGDNGFISSAMEENGVGNSGNINIATINLSLINGSILSDMQGRGNGGEITINAVKSFAIDNGNILSGVSENGIGDAGKLNITTTNFSLTDGIVEISTFGEGNGGDITIAVSESIILEDSNISSFVAPEALGNSGALNITGNSISLIDNSQINVSTLGRGDGGIIDVNTTDSITIDGSNILNLVAPEALGNSGNITLSTGNLSLNNNAQVNASSVGRGNGGNVAIEADTVTLNRGLIFAANQPSQPAISNEELRIGGNIDFEVADLVILQNNSTISAEAGSNANGGNINLDTDLVIAFSGNNDIVTNAVEGQGGDINIEAEAIFGLEERPLDFTTNDINASSEATGLDGTVDINNPAVDPTTGLIELPSVGDASDQISQNPCQQGVGSQFIVTGKGGLPPNPTETLNSDRITVDLVEPLSREADKETKEQAGQIGKDTVTEAVPAMGWVFNDRGEVTLTAYSNTDTQRRSQQHRTACHNISP